MFGRSTGARVTMEANMQEETKAGWFFSKIRLEATCNDRGGWTYSIWVHGPSQNKQALTCVVRDLFDTEMKAASTEDAMLVLHGILGEQFLPGHSD